MVRTRPLAVIAAKSVTAQATHEIKMTKESRLLFIGWDAIRGTNGRRSSLAPISGEDKYFGDFAQRIVARRASLS